MGPAVLHALARRHAMSCNASERPKVYTSKLCFSLLKCRFVPSLPYRFVIRLELFTCLDCLDRFEGLLQRRPRVHMIVA